MVKNLLLIFFYIVFVTIAQVLLKISMSYGLQKISIDFFIKAFSSGRVLLGLFLYGLSFLVWLVVLNRVEITFAYPLLSLSVVFVAVISWIFMDETLNIYRLAGIILTIIGAWLIIKS